MPILKRLKKNNKKNFVKVVLLSSVFYIEYPENGYENYPY